MEEKGYWRAS